MHRTATRFGLIVTVAFLAAAKVAAQQAPSAASPHLQPNAGGEAAAVTCHDALDFIQVPGFPSAVRMFALTPLPP